VGADVRCFEPATMNFVRGYDREFGAVGAPDSDEISDPAAHCDNADFLEAGYPRTPELARAGLLECGDTCSSGSAKRWTTPVTSWTTTARGMVGDTSPGPWREPPARAVASGRT